MEKKEQLSIEENVNMLKEVLQIIRSYPKLNDLEVDYEQASGCNLSLWSMPGAVYISKNIMGGFQGMIPFTIMYSSKPKTEKQRLLKVEFLNALSKWIEHMDYPKISERVIEKIEPTSVPYKDGENEDGTTDYIVTFNLVYRKEE